MSADEYPDGQSWHEWRDTDGQFSGGQTDASLISGPQRYTEAFSVYICFCISLTHLQHLNIWSVSPVHSKLNKLQFYSNSKLHVIVLCTPDFTGQLSHSHLSGKLCARLVWVKMHWKYLKNEISVESKSVYVCPIDTSETICIVIFILCFILC